jgi:glutamate dehydrogenase/leucine dehydrogenase
MGGFYVLSEAIKEKGLEAKKTKVAIQGFGNAGATMAHILYEAGYKIVALADSKSIVYNDKGINIDEAENYKKEKGSLAGLEGTKEISIKEFFALDVDVIIPAALENQITKDNANDIKAKIVLELANGPSTPEADEIMFNKGIMLVPDVLANAGGVTVSYFEWLQNISNNYWSEEEVDAELKERMIPSFVEILKMSKEYKTDLRTAAFILSLRRIESAAKVRG